MSDLLSCGHPPTPQAPGACGTGYATKRDDSKVCYACADDSEREQMLHTDIMTAYLSNDGKTITTWSGGTLATVLHSHERRVGFGRAMRRYWNAIDATGARWYGNSAGTGMITTMRRTKGK